MSLKITVRTTGVKREIRRLKGLSKAIDTDEVLFEAAKQMASDARGAKLKGWKTPRTDRATNWETIKHTIEITFMSVYSKSEESLKGVAKWMLKELKRKTRVYSKMIEKAIVDVFNRGR